MPVRITDSYKPGYERVSLGDVAKTTPPGGASTVGSPILNQAQAEVLGVKSVALPTLPIILTHPSSQTVTEPAPAIFTCEAAGDGITYQWRLNGADMVGSTSPTLNIGATITNYNGRVYTCAVTNMAGTVVSNPAVLTVTPSVASYRYFRFILNAEPTGAEVDWNEIQFFSGLDAGGSQFTAAGVSTSHTAYMPGVLIDGNTADSTGGGQYSSFNKPVTGKYWQIDLGQARAVQSVNIYAFTGLSWSYFVPYIHIDASVDGSTWTRLKSNFHLASAHLNTINF